MHATWQALQPMQLGTSMSLATSSVVRTWGLGVVVAERAAMSSDCNEDMAQAFSMLTMNDLYSGVCVFASPTNGVSVFTRYPRLATPTKPQWLGSPTVSTLRPSTSSCGMRWVTTATHLMKPRLDETFTMSPLPMPLALASSRPISTNCCGWITADDSTFLVQ